MFSSGVDLANLHMQVVVTGAHSESQYVPTYLPASGWAKLRLVDFFMEDEE